MRCERGTGIEVGCRVVTLRWHLEGEEVQSGKEGVGLGRKCVYGGPDSVFFNLATQSVCHVMNDQTLILNLFQEMEKKIESSQLLLEYLSVSWSGSPASSSPMTSYKGHRTWLSSRCGVGDMLSLHLTLSGVDGIHVHLASSIAAVSSP